MFDFGNSLRNVNISAIKNEEITKRLKTLLARKDLLLNFAIIVITVITITKIYDGQALQKKELEVKVLDLEKKSQVVSDYEKAQSQFDNFFNTLPQASLEVDAIINQINQLAIAHHIQILTFSPRGEFGTELFDQTNIQLVISAVRYEDIGYFVYDIEHSNLNLRVESWATNKATQTTNRSFYDYSVKKETADDEIKVDMEIAAIKFRK